MRLLTDVATWRSAAHDVRARGGSVGLVPTMGALHEGHGSLVRAALSRGCEPFVTIFVNPRQFNDPRDLERYPRDLDADVARCEAWGASVVVAPSVEAMWPAYPAPTLTTVSVSGLTETFEGADRPGHFDGVASVVTKLFAVTGPSLAFFGEKDFQQLAVVRRLSEDLALGVEVVGCPIVRESDGLALSSRNARLSAAGRVTALGLFEALRDVNASPHTASSARAAMRRAMEARGVDVAYADVVHPDTLEPLRDDEAGEARALVAGLVDGVRLIDNAAVTIVTKGE